MNEETGDWLKSDISREYFELVRFPSVGADPAHLRDCVQCATWLRQWLRKTGAEAELLLAPGFANPVVYAERKGAEGAPTLLVYGHYDVQSADPADEWKTPPFEPTVVGDRIYARGAQDDKGQLFAFLNGVLAAGDSELPREGARVTIAAGSRVTPREGARVTMGDGARVTMGDDARVTMGDGARVTGKGPNLKIIIDGQEESQSGTLTALLQDSAFRSRIAADVLLVCDTSAAAELRPAIVAGLRGVAHFTVKLTGANRDLHSGEYGGIAPNAAQGMAELLASLHNPDGSIAVAGFRDGIEPPTHDELRLAEAGMPGELDYEQDIGCPPCGGQMGKTLVQRNCFEPTIEINGMWSGHTGAGAKTIIPGAAYAKLSMRLVPGQSPRAAFAAVKTHFETRCPKGMKVEFPDFNPGTPGFRLPIASPIFRLAEDLLRELDPRGPVFMWDGASIPVVSLIREASGAAPLLVGWGQSEDRIHSPNESYSIRQFELARKWGKLIAEAM